VTPGPPGHDPAGRAAAGQPDVVRVGCVERIDDDSSGEFFGELAERYGLKLDGPPEDARYRVVYVVKPTSVRKQ